MKQMKKTLCLLLALVMLLSLGPVPAFAEGETSVCTEHVYGEDGLCTICGAEKPADPPACTEHVYGEDGLCMVCGAEKPADPPACTEHVYGEDGLCTVCGAEKPAETSVCTEHVYGEDGLCTVCGAEKPVDPPVCTEHVYGEDGLCTVCGAEQPEETEIEPSVCTEHVYGEDGLCTVCGAEKPADRPACTEHVYGEDGLCTVCGAEKPAETVTETVPEVDYPMQSFNFRADAGTEITVDAPEGAFPEGTKMTVSEEQDLTELQALIDADEELEGVIVAAADISFYYNNEKIQPLVPVYVSYASAAAAEAEEPKLIHIGDDNRIDVMDEVTAETVEASSQAMQAMSGFGAAAETPASTEMLKLSFRAGSFSRYAILGKAPTAPVQPLDTEPTRAVGELSMSGSWPAQDATTYVMAETEQKGFSLHYEIEGPQDIVLVVEGLKYGAEFAVIPDTDADVTEVLQLDNHTVALRLANTDAKIELDVSFTMRHIALSDEYAAELIDGGLQNTRIAATEYTWSGPLSEVLTSGAAGAYAELWEGKPACDLNETITVATATIPRDFGSYTGQTYAQGYKYSVSSLTRQGVSFSNVMLGNAGMYTYAYYYGPYSNGAIRVNLPAAYNDGGALMEITAIRVYEPTDLVRFVPSSINRAMFGPYYAMGGDIGGGQTFYWGRYGNPFLYNAYYSHPKNWVAGERTLDPETGKYYYEVTPPTGTRWFNTESKGLTACTGVLPLGWVLADETQGLTPGTMYKGQDTVFLVKLPGDQEAKKVTITGPEIHTWKLQERSIVHRFNPIRAISHRNQTNISSQYLTDENVVVGSIVRDQWFSQVYNSSYVNRSIDTEYVPEYTGPVTQRYDFPYQIQPTKIYLREYNQATQNLLSEKSTLTALRWETWDGQSGAADDATVAAVNAEINRRRGGTNLLLEYALPAGLEIKRVELEWARLSTEKGPTAKYSSDTCTMQTSFDFRVNNRSGYGETGTLPQYTRVHAVYTESYDGVYNSGAPWSPAEVQNIHYTATDPRNGPQNGQQYLWFRLKDQLDPDLYGQGLKSDDLRNPNIKFLGDGLTDDLGHVGFQVGSYGERRDFIHDPVIELWLESGWYQYGLTGITQAQSVSLLTGAFTATKEASGWTFQYTTKNHGAELLSWTVPTLTEDTPVQIPLEEGDCFTSLKLRFDGEVDLSHENEDDLRTVIWLMKDVQVLLTDENPITGARITTTQDYVIGDLQLHGKVNYDVTECAAPNPETGNIEPHCGCLLSSGVDTHVLGQEMKHPMSGTRRNAGANGAYVYSTRKASLAVNLHEPEGGNIMQGGSIKRAWQFYGRPTTVYPGSRMFDDQQNLPGTVWPWEALGETFYVELTDAEFVFDPANSKIFGYTLDEPGVEWDTVTGTDGKTYLKIGFSESFQRRIFAVDGGWATNNWDSWWTASNWAGVGWMNNPYYYSDTNSRAQPYGALELAFTSLPGTQLGDHHPIGAIYFDASGMLENYTAYIAQPEGEMTGYDYDRTKYAFTGTNVVEDPAGLSATGVTGPKLFYYDGSGYTVRVDISLQAGAELAPGKNSAYNFDPRVTSYRPTEEDSLNALLTLKGSGNENAGSIYDMESYVVLPRIGTPIRWSETIELEGGGTQTTYHSQENTELDLFLRGAVTPISNPSALAMTVQYTTDPIPEAYRGAADAAAAAAALAGLSYVDAGEITDWNAVTGFRVVVPEMTVKSAINLRVDLRSDPKETVDVLSAFSGGAFRYKISQGSAYSNNGLLQLCEWDYENIQIACGRVFWDLYDENGTRNGDNNTEPYINGVTVTLYDAYGTQIDQQVTANSQGGSNASNNGVFPALRTFKPDAGQYIVITPPTDQNWTAKLTKQSTSIPIQSAVDSDFDRETNTLTLGTLTANGLSNISAGFVRLPKIETVNMELLVGETKSADAIITEFVSNTSYPNNILVNGGYKISFTGVDATIATLDNVPALARSGNSTTQLKSTYTFTGVAPGEYEVTATVENALGDEVSTTFTVTVVPNVFYVYHSSDGTLEAVPMPDEGETVNLVDKIRTGHRYGGYYNASGAVTEENVNAAKDPALSAGRTGAAVTGAVLYTGDSLKNGSVRFWTKTDAAVAGTNDAGTELQPTRGAVYYLKEVPVKYLQSVTRYVYTVETGKLDALYFISDVDDTYYNQLYFDVQTEHGSYVCKLAGSFSFLQRGSTTITQSVKPSDFADVVRGFVASANASALLNQGITEDMFVTPYWKTLDGVDVPGVGFTMSLGDETTNPETGIQFYG